MLIRGPSRFFYLFHQVLGPTQCSIFWGEERFNPFSGFTQPTLKCTKYLIHPTKCYKIYHRPPPLCFPQKSTAGSPAAFLPELIGLALCYEFLNKNKVHRLASIQIHPNSASIRIELHWHPVRFRPEFRICIFVRNCLIGTCIGLFPRTLCRSFLAWHDGAEDSESGWRSGVPKSKSRPRLISQSWLQVTS